MRAIIVAGRGLQDHEFIYPLYRLDEAGCEVDVAVRAKLTCQCIIGARIEPTIDIPDDPSPHDLLVIPGGVKAMEHMRLDSHLVKYVAAFHAAGKPVAAICSGTQLLISAGLCRGRKISGYPAIKIDIENAGGTYVNAPAVIHDRIITSPHYRHVGQWMAAALLVARDPSWEPSI